MVSVKELIDHIYKASFEIMKGTEYEENFFFYHDALTQLTDQESINYMQEKGMLKH